MAGFSLLSEGVTKTKGTVGLMIPTEKKSEEFLTPNSYIGQHTVSPLHTWLSLGSVPVDTEQPRDKRAQITEPVTASHFSRDNHLQEELIHHEQGQSQYRGWA